MPPTSKDQVGSSSNSRRKSMNLFSRAGLSNLTPLNTNVGETEAGEEKKEKKKLHKRNSIFGIGPHANTSKLQNSALSMSPVATRDDPAPSPKLRPNTLHKGKPASLFGSFGRKSTGSYAHDAESADALMDGNGSASPVDELPRGISPGHNLLHHGEVATHSGMFRNKKEYMVLTDTHIFRFKSQSRAADAFPSIRQFHGRNIRHHSSASVGSATEITSTHSYSSVEGENRIPLTQIVTAYKLEDGRPFFTTEVVYLDEEYHGVGSVQLMLQDPKDADLWQSSIIAAAQRARILMHQPFPDRVVDYLAAALEMADDYDPNHFKLFRVVQRGAISKGGKTSSDDLQKLNSSVFYMVVGINRVHFVPLPDFAILHPNPLKLKASRMVFGTVALTEMVFNEMDDRFQLAFRLPMQPIKSLDLASSATADIALSIFTANQLLKPQWQDYSFRIVGPKALLENLAQQPLAKGNEGEFGCLDQSLIAYCAAYNCDPNRIQYAIDWDADQAPEFRLFPPARGSRYTLLELLAVFRALRYNESFRSISFKGVDLHSLHTLCDNFGSDGVAWTTRSGIQISKYYGFQPHLKSLLYQEVQSLALKSEKLKRLDFAGCLPKRRPKDNYDAEGGEVEKDPGCEIVAAIFPLLRYQLTCVNWVILSGIELGETDFDDMIPALNEPKARLKAIECARCGLNDRGIMQLLGHMARQNASLERIDISDNPGKIHVESFQESIIRFSRLRKLNISRAIKSSGEESLFKLEVMLLWRLEELLLDGVPVNDRTLDDISTYLASPSSDKLRILSMDQCSLTGSHVALMMRSMTKVPGEARGLHLSVSDNRLEKGVEEIVKAIESNQTPYSLSVRMIEFAKELHFKRLLQALRNNTTVQLLDISKASLPYDAGEDTCDTLRLLFAENTTLEELDISGEQAHLEVTRFGIGLNHALTGLKQNKNLKTLRIEYQNLGLEGANTLSSVLEENTGLQNVYCEHNNLTLQAFTILVNALANNFHVLYLPAMATDQDEAIKRMSHSIRDNSIKLQPQLVQDSTRSSVRKTINNLKHPHTTPSQLAGANQQVTTQDLDTVIKVLEEKWQTEINRLSAFLERNNNLANGIVIDDYGSDGIVGGSGNGNFGPGYGGIDQELLRPSTAMSDHGILEHVLTTTTPKAELENPVNDQYPGIADKLSSLGLADINTGSSGGRTSVSSSKDKDGLSRRVKSVNYKSESETSQPRRADAEDISSSDDDNMTEIPPTPKPASKSAGRLKVHGATAGAVLRDGGKSPDFVSGNENFYDFEFEQGSLTKEH